jgi:site-specific recombinase XerD
MPVKRDTPDGLPFNVYERRGKRVYRIFYKEPSPPRAVRFSLTCDVNDKIAIQQTRREAIRRAGLVATGGPADGSFAALAKAWLKAQQDKPMGSEGRRAETTLAENKREIDKLISIMGDAPVADLRKSDAYDYLEAAEKKSRSAKANKEISLARTVLEYAVRKGMIETNPFADVQKLVTARKARLVTEAELDLAVEMGRRAGGARLIVALALKTAFLCLRRSVEVRDLQLPAVQDAAGIRWTAAKRKRGTVARVGYIEWTPELRATIDEVLAVKRFATGVESWYVFGNMHGQKYTKGGWKKMLANLMELCAAEAKERDVPFERFSLQDCRPMGVTAKITRGDDDVQDATMHSNDRMIKQVYDRRAVTTAKPAR